VSGVTAALSSDEAEVLGSLDSLDDGGDDTLGNLVKILPVASLALLVGGGVVFKEPIVDNLNIFSDYLAGMGPSGFALYMAVRARRRRRSQSDGGGSLFILLGQRGPGARILLFHITCVFTLCVTLCLHSTHTPPSPRQVYCGLELLAVPAIPLTMTAGALFGVIPGTIAASVAGTVAATGAFVAARYFLRQKVCVPMAPSSNGACLKASGIRLSHVCLVDRECGGVYLVMSFVWRARAAAGVVHCAVLCVTADRHTHPTYKNPTQVVDWAEQNPKFKAIDAAIADEGLKIVVLLRLSPLLPLSLSNYLYGLTSLELRPYVLGSWLGMLPGTFLYVQTGAVRCEPGPPLSKARWVWTVCL